MRGRDRTGLVLGLATQVAAVRAQLERLGLAAPGPRWGR